MTFPSILLHSCYQQPILYTFLSFNSSSSMGLHDNFTEENMEESDENIETIMDSFEDRDSLLYSGYDTGETNFQCNLSRYSSHNESLMVIEDDDDSLSDISSSGIIDLRNELNSPTSINIPEQTTTVIDDSEDDSDSDVEIFEPLVRLEKNNVSGATKNTNLFTRQKENNSLNVKKFFIPKHDASLVKFNPSVKSNQFKIASTATVNRPKTTTTHLQPESSGNTEIVHKKSFLKPKQQLRITSSKESKSEVYLVPHNGMNYMISKGIPTKSPLLKSNSSLSPALKAHSTIIRPTEQKKQFMVVSSKDALRGGNKEEPKFIARMQPLPGGKYKMVPDQGQVPINLESVFKRNPNFTKQKLATHPAPNGHKVSDIFHIGNSYQLANIKETRNFQHKILDVPSVKSSWSKMSRTVEPSNASRNKKFIPHTVTSKDPIERNSKVSVQNGKVKINTNCHQKMSSSPRCIQLSSNSESLKQSDSLPLSHTRHGKISKNDHKIIQLLSSNSPTKSKTKLNSYKMLKNSDDDSNSSDDEMIKVNNSETRRSQNLNINRAVEEHSNKHKISLSNEIIDLDALSDSSDEDDTSDQFISCKYEYCDTLVYEPELIDDLYCSLACKKLDIKQTVTEEEHFIDETSNTSEKTTVDRKNLLTKLENRINKRKQKLKTSCPEDMVNENDDFNEQLINFFNKPSKEESKPLKSISLPEAIDDDDDDDNNYFDLKLLIEDKDVLKYMTGLQFKSAPKKLFNRPFPTEKNLFAVGQKLEGIDPKHEALFCVMTIADVCGYRIKLHFDGYEDDYDFWVNADCPDLFHPGWCEMNLRILQPPNNYGNAFNWISYLKHCQALPAPKRNFVSTKNLNSCKNQHKFHIGGKLEALDKLTRTLPKQLICVATVADILGNRIRIHFDGWTDDFDYWADITSTNIHPVRWCDNNGRTLSPPSGYNDMKGRKPFNWTEYLTETNSEPIPEDAFVRRPLRDFSIKMMIEVVDLVVPRLLRIAKVVDVRGDELKIVYDGFDNDYAYWVEDDSPDIHPVGWSLKTNHPIELPPASNTVWSCNIRGCKGYGNSSNSMKTDHVDIVDCPYEMDSWKTAVAGLAKMPDRLKTHNVIITTTLTSSKIKSDIHQDDENKEKTSINTEHKNLAKIKKKINEKRLNLLLNVNAIEPECDTVIRNTLFNDTIPSNDNNELRKTLGLGLVGYDLGSVSMETLSSYWTKHNAQLGIPLFNNTDARKWSIQEVASYVQKVVECCNSNSNNNEEISISDRFIDQAIDGEAFLMLNQDEIMKILKVPLGQAIKITNAIIMLRQRIIKNECM